MEIVAFLVPFVLLGVAVLFIAFSGGPGAAREAYLTRGAAPSGSRSRCSTSSLGVVVPGAGARQHGRGQGGTGALQTEELTEETSTARMLFRQQCASCHSLDAVNARGVTGPNLDEIGEVTPERVLNAIKNGGTGQDRMPAGPARGRGGRGGGGLRLGGRRQIGDSALAGLFRRTAPVTVPPSNPA